MTRVVIPIIDGLMGTSETPATNYPASMRQICMVHISHLKLSYASLEDHKTLTKVIMHFYTLAGAIAAVPKLETV